MQGNQCSGYFTKLDGEDFYKIENYNQMDDFFMTITSSSDIWNFCWSQGGITAGRIDCDHAIFPYYTADKVQDAAGYTGPYTLIAVETAGSTEIWEPFAKLRPAEMFEKAKNGKGLAIVRNIYKNISGTKVWFEEINNNLQLSFRYGWTSSAKYGLVRMAKIENLGSDKKEIAVLDGCQNILPACCTADFQNSNSVLLDAYKKTEISDQIALFSVSSIVTDKAEPNEGLFANTCWFSFESPLLLDKQTPENFCNYLLKNPRTDLAKLAGDFTDSVYAEGVNGKRPACFTLKAYDLGAKETQNWFMVFDTSLDATRAESLKNSIKNRSAATADLVADIEAGVQLMQQYIAAADGVQKTQNQMVCAHHSANVMFNVMRGGIFANQGKIQASDFIDFVKIRNFAKAEAARQMIGAKAGTEDFSKVYLLNEELLDAAKQSGDMQLVRLATEYMPITFSRRHGDPSRPWNRFNIKLRDENQNPILNYEGNWRDIFQNWEALAWSYPSYIKQMYSKFLNATTIDGFNPYHISKAGLNWEEPDPDNPWAQIGYWGDHQIIYLCKLLEFYKAYKPAELLKEINEPVYSTANVPYRIKSFSEICQNPRSTILFDRDLSEKLKDNAKKYGTDAKLWSDEQNQPVLQSFSTKVLQLLIGKLCNFVPGGGIWLNTQRPEWNDANNALAGYGLSVVTLCYINRFLNFLIKLYGDCNAAVEIDSTVWECFEQLGKLFAECDALKCAKDEKLRYAFVSKAGTLFEAERTSLYAKGFARKNVKTESAELVRILETIQKAVSTTIMLNKRDDGLFHSYNTMKIGSDSIELSYLQEMLEGQVAILSSGALATAKEVIELVNALKKSALYEPRQNSYMLYPNKKLPHFCNKNTIPADPTAQNAIEQLKGTLNFESGRVILKDCNGNYHFNGEFRNKEAVTNILNSLDGAEKLNDEQKQTVLALYEHTFRHQNFLGRSGTFFAYEGLGSIYWHMVAKLLLAVEENIPLGTSDAEKAELTALYYDIQKGIGFNKQPEIYGAFPADPYSHTPHLQGAKQPGMTGQVKEEILCRWKELGLYIEDGKAGFKPEFLKAEEFDADGKLEFTWCGVNVCYVMQKTGAEKGMQVTYAGGKTEKISDTCQLTGALSTQLFNRSGEISQITVYLA